MRNRGRRARHVVVSASIAVALVLGGCGTQDDAAPPDEGPVHAHGIGVDPADGAVYVASHFGLFVVEGDALVRVDGPARDYMGFTVAGPEHFLASGHPAIADDDLLGPDDAPLLGLVESTDAGRTWKSVSLPGEADFHALRHAHGRIVGWDATSGGLLVSHDGRDWEPRAVVSLLDVAVAPDDPDHLVATGDGLGRSLDGGRTWEPIEGPALAWLDWPEPAELWGTDADGNVWVGDPDGGWESRGRVPGIPEAFTATDGTRLLAAQGGTVWGSDDGGRTWSELARW